MPPAISTTGNAAHDHAAEVHMFLGAMKALELDGASPERVAAAYSKTPEEFAAACHRVISSFEGKLAQGRP